LLSISSRLSAHILFFSSLRSRPPSFTLFPYTTLFRSAAVARVSRLPLHSAGHPASPRDSARTQLPKANLHFGDRASTPAETPRRDRKSTRLNSSHVAISYAVFCLKKKKKKKHRTSSVD